MTYIIPSPFDGDVINPLDRKGNKKFWEAMPNPIEPKIKEKKMSNKKKFAEAMRAFTYEEMMYIAEWIDGAVTALEDDGKGADKSYYASLLISIAEEILEEEE